MKGRNLPFGKRSSRRHSLVFGKDGVIDFSFSFFNLNLLLIGGISNCVEITRESRMPLTCQYSIPSVLYIKRTPYQTYSIPKVLHTKHLISFIPSTAYIFRTKYPCTSSSANCQTTVRKALHQLLLHGSP